MNQKDIYIPSYHVRDLHALGYYMYTQGFYSTLGGFRIRHTGKTLHVNNFVTDELIISYSHFKTKYIK